MSPKSGGRAQRRQRRNLLISVLVVVAISLGSFAAVFAAKWSPRLGLDLAGGVAVVYTAEGHNVSQADLNETVNILNLRVNGLGVSGARGADHREEPDLGLHSRRDQRPAGPRPDRADGAHVLPAGALLRLPAGGPEGGQEQGPAEGHRDVARLYPVVPARRRPTSTSRRTARPRGTRRTTCRPTRSTPPTLRRAWRSRATPTARCSSQGSAARATAPPWSAACSDRPR